MKYFLDMTTKPKEEKTEVNITPQYLEIQKYMVDNGGGITYTYVIPWNDHALFISACWGHQFDGWGKLIADPKMGKTWFKILKDTYPTPGQLLENGVSGRYSQGVLMNIEDPDDGEQKWVIGTVVGNLSINNTEELEYLLSSDRMVEAYTLVISSSVQTVVELTTRKISTKNKMLAMGQGLVNSQLEVLETASVWVPKITNLIKGS